MSSQARGARKMVLVSWRPSPATAGKRATDGQRSRISASLICGGTTPVTACCRISSMEKKYKSKLLCRGVSCCRDAQQHFLLAAHGFRLLNRVSDLFERKLLDLSAENALFHQP